MRKPERKKIIRFHEANVFPAFQVYETLWSFFNLLLLGIRYMLHVCLMIISVTNITPRLKAFQESKEWGETLWKKNVLVLAFPVSETLVQSTNNRSGQTMNKKKTKQNKTRQNKKNGYKDKQMFLIIFLYIWIEEF